MNIDITGYGNEKEVLDLLRENWPAGAAVYSVLVKKGDGEAIIQWFDSPNHSLGTEHLPFQETPVKLGDRYPELNGVLWGPEYILDIGRVDFNCPKGHRAAYSPESPSIDIVLEFIQDEGLWVRVGMGGTDDDLILVDREGGWARCSDPWEHKLRCNEYAW